MVELNVSDALNLAAKKHQEGKLHEAEIIYRKILDENPNNPDALHLLGLIAHQIGKYEESAKLISKAIKLTPNNALYYGNLGMVYDALGKEEESAKCFIKALERDSKYNGAHLAHYNLGIFFRDKGQIKEALEHFNKAIELEGNFPDAHWNRGLILLLLGNLREGWKDYEYRFKKKKPADSRVFNKPKWDGSQLEGRKILIVSEQGFGDNIQFIRYIPLIKERGGYVILECKKELKELFKDIPGVDKFVDKESDSVPNIDFDYYAHLMSLPMIFGTNLDNIPDKIPYLKADSALVEKLKAKFDTNNFKIGIVWVGNPNQENNKNRSTTFEKFKCLKELPGIKLYSLQKGANHQLNEPEITDMAGYISDFAETAAVIENLDLIITVDTSVAHLAGAMGKPVWTLLTFAPDWRWLMNRKDCPWYPGMRLFRQKKPGDWDSLFNEVKKELRKLFST